MKKLRLGPSVQINLLLVHWTISCILG